MICFDEVDNGDVVVYEYVTPGGDWGWLLGSITMKLEDVLEVQEWFDATQRRKELRDEIENTEHKISSLSKEIMVLREKLGRQRQVNEANIERAHEDLDRALAALRSIDPRYLREMRTYRTPPDLVKLTLTAVVYLLTNTPLSQLTWDAVLKIVRRSDFIQMVMDYDPGNDNVEFSRDLMGTFLNNPSLTVESVNDASLAAGPLLQWLYAKCGAYDAQKKYIVYEEEVELMDVNVFVAGSDPLHLLFARQIRELLSEFVELTLRSRVSVSGMLIHNSVHRIDFPVKLNNFSVALRNYRFCSSKLPLQIIALPANLLFPQLNVVHKSLMLRFVLEP